MRAGERMPEIVATSETILVAGGGVSGMIVALEAGIGLRLPLRK